MKNSKIKKMLLTIVILLGSMPSPANATTLICSTAATAPFDNSDAVVLASVVSSSHEPVTLHSIKPAVVTIKVEKYWKLKNDEIPQMFLMHAPGLEPSRLYILFLKKISSDSPEYVEGKNYYQKEVCSPTIEISGRSLDSFKGALYLNSQEVHDVNRPQQ